MDKKIQTWMKLVELAEMEMDNAAKTLALMRQRENEDAAQLDALENYSKEYNQQGMKHQGDLMQVQTYRLFANKLQQALQAQDQKLKQSVEMVEKAQQAWFEKRARFKALNQLLEKIQSDRDKKLSKQEQKLLDELASQQSSQEPPFS